MKNMFEVSTPSQAHAHSQQDQMHFASIVVYVQPQFIDAVAAKIDTFAGAEVGPRNDQLAKSGKLIVTLETAQLGDVTELTDKLAQMQGVFNTALVYHHIAQTDELDTLIETHAAQEQVPK